MLSTLSVCFFMQRLLVLKQCCLEAIPKLNLNALKFLKFDNANNTFEDKLVLFACSVFKTTKLIKSWCV